MTHEQAVQTLATERYMLDEMSGDDRDAFEAHFFSCEVCADDVRVAAAMVQGAQAGFAGEHSPKGQRDTAALRETDGQRDTVVRPFRAAWYQSAKVAWLAAAALLVVSTYQSVFMVRRDVSPVAIAPVTLRPASRGAETAVTMPADGGPVSLAVEINEPVESGQLAYSIAAAEGGRIASGRAAAPAAGTPLFLVIPSSTLAAPGRYVLSVHDASASNRLLGEYRFAVARK